MATFNPRPKQQEVLAYKGGMMGVSAVPGSGKTRTLSALAAKLVASAGLEEDQEVLIVTLVNSAVNHFSQQVAEFITDYGLLPGFAYRVRTLHGLANDIVRERPGLVGLADDFAIVDEREAGEILQDAVDAYTRTNQNMADYFLAPEYMEKAQIRTSNWPEHVRDIANSFIRQAKDWQLSPELIQAQIRAMLDDAKETLPLVEMCLVIYADYQRGLAYRGAVDFQDLIRLALRALQLDEGFLKRLQTRFPYVLEDEAQDSSQLQEQILRLLVGKKGNWVRVGDPNQAIYETFTTANPTFLRNFVKQKGVQERQLPNSGRSTQSIIDLANGLISWSQRHPVDEIRQRDPLLPPAIEPTPPGDPQPNPPDAEGQVFIGGEGYTPGDEMNMVVKSLGRWLQENPDKTAAILVPRNKRGFEAVNALKKAKIEYVELLRSTTTTREAAGALGNILQWLGSPTSPLLLATVYRVWQRDNRDDADAARSIDEIAKLLSQCHQVEDFISPRLNDWLDMNEAVSENHDLREHLLDFRALLQRWQQAVILPIDQLLLTIAQDIFFTSADLAIGYAIALYLRRAATGHPEWRLREFTEELARVAKNERRFLGLTTEDTGFNPDAYKGKVAVATIHSAKGLEWDRVHLLSANNYDFPSAQQFDTFISEKWFVRDKLNLEAEALEQLRALVNSTPYLEGQATQSARIDYAAERLRLFYVAITRARRELIITWNTGRDQQQAALPLVALRTFWEMRNRTMA